MPRSIISTTRAHTFTECDKIVDIIFGAAGADRDTGNPRQNGRFNFRCHIYIQQRLPWFERAAEAPIPQIQFVNWQLFWTDE
jgi:hypothetical protein